VHLDLVRPEHADDALEAKILDELQGALSIGEPDEVDDVGDVGSG